MARYPGVCHGGPHCNALEDLTVTGTTSRAGLLERADELAHLEDLLDRAEGGSGGAAVIRGPAGIGKTLLLDRLRFDAGRRGFAPILHARCSQLESDYAFGLVRNLFEPVLHALSAADRASVSSGAARFAQPALDPSAPVPFGALPLSANPSGGITHGLYWLSVKLADDGPAAA